MKSTRSVYDVGNECVVVKNCGLLVMGGDLCSEGCGQCDQKKSPNVSKSCPKMISLEKW